MMNVGGKRVIRHKHDCSSKNDRNIIVMTKPVIVPFTPTGHRDDTDTESSQHSSSRHGSQMSEDCYDSPNSQSSDPTRYIRNIVARKRACSPTNLTSVLSDDDAVVVVDKKKK